MVWHIKNFLWTCWIELQVLFQIILPPKGIIYMEEQLVQWAYAFISVILGNWLKAGGSIIIICIGIVMLFNLGGLNRLFHGLTRQLVMRISRIVAWLLTLIINLVLAWVYLIYGAVRGQLDDSNEPWTFWFHSVGGHIHFHYSRTHRPLHFRLGRWLYRKLFGLVDRFAPDTTSPRTKEHIARGLALFVILWGCWHIPYDITH